MAEERDDVRATSEELAADADDLAALERRKVESDLSDHELAQLSRRAESLADEMAEKARTERRIAEGEKSG